MKWSLSVFMILGIASAAANTTLRVRSVHTSQDPYEIVLPGGQETPGIYTFIPGKKDPQLVVKGTVYGAGRSHNGVLAQFPMVHQTGRNEMLAVVDGKLTIFANNSSPDRKDSRIVLGENTPVLDLLTGDKVKIEPLPENFFEAVHVFMSNRSASNSELLLISLKQPNIHGSGLTVALYLSKDPGPLRLTHPPTVIDYSFLDATALAKIPTPNHGQIFSRSAILNLSTPRETDDRLLREYREYLRRASQSLTQGSKSKPTDQPKGANPSFAVPYYDFSLGRAALVPLPKSDLLTKPVQIVQQIDPITERAQVIISEDGSFSQSSLVNGRVDFDSKTGRYLIRILNQDSRATKSQGVPVFIDSSPLILTSIDGKDYVLLKGDLSQRYFPVDLALAGFEGRIFDSEPYAVHYSISENPLDTKDRSSTHYLIISTKNGRGKGITRLVRVTETLVGIQASSAVEIRRAHEDPTRLKKRIRIEPWIADSSRNHLLFDDRTERFVERTNSSGEKADPESERLEEVPFLDLTAYSGTGRALPRAYRKPELVIGLKAPMVDYIQFQPVTGKISNSTGLYVRGDSGTRSQRSLDFKPENFQFMQGRALRKSDFQPKSKPKTRSEDEIDPVLELQQKIETGVQSPSTVGVTLIPMLGFDQIERDLKQMQLAVVTHSDSPGDLIQSRIFAVNLPIPQSDFLSAKFIVGRRNHKDTLNLLVFFRTQSDGNQNGGILIYSNLQGLLETVSSTRDAGQSAIRRAFKITGPKGTIALEDVRPRVLYRGEVSESLLKSRIVYDAEGRPLWILTPDLEQNDPKFRAVFLAEPEKPVHVNVGTSGIRLRFDEVLDDSTDLSLGGGSKWALLDRSAVLNRVPGFSAYTENRNKELSGKKNEKDIGPIRREEQTFADLPKYLDELAKSSSTEREHRVLLVSKEMMPLVRNLMMTRFLQRPDASEGGPFSLMNSDFYLYLFDPAYTPKETKNELLKIGLRKTKSELLVADMDTIVAIEAQHPPESRTDGKSVQQDDLQTDQEESLEAENEGPELEAEGPSAQSVADTSSERAKAAPQSETSETADSERFQFPYTRLAYIAAEGETLGSRLPSFSQKGKRMNALVLATPEQWRDYTLKYPRERKAGVFDSFKVDAKFLTSSWTVWPPRSSRATKETVELSRASVSRDEYQVFDSLDQLLNRLANPQTEATHQVLVVPEEIKPLVTRLIDTRWATEHRDLGEGWNHRNRNLALYRLLPATTQEDVWDNFASLSGSLASRRPVLYADMADVLRAARVQSQNPTSSYRLRDPVVASTPRESILGSVNSEDADQNSETELERTQVPHLIWWIASEGRKVQPRKTRGWKLRDEVKPTIPTLIVATEKELQALEQDASFEARFFGIRESFDVSRLEKPTEMRRRALIEELFRRPEVATLQYRFRKDNLENDESRRQLIGLLVGRVEQIASQLGIEPTYAFLKIYSALKKALTEDVELRRSREIDSPYLSRLFAKVFPLPLNWEILRPDDPLQRLRDPVQAARGLQEAGYEGATELKVRAIQALTNHTRGGSDKGRKVPSSLVLIGDKGTGKTFLVETLIRYEGLKLYNFSKPHDEEAGAIIIRVMDLIEKDDPTHPEKMSVDKALAHVSHFLSLPNGWRGLVLFDDLHKAGSTEILRKVMTFIQTMLEAEGGALRVRRFSTDPRKESEVKEIPPRNIRLVLTLNPTKDNKKRERFIDRWSSAKDPVREAVASLTRNDYEIEDSIFSRFGDVIDLSEFPRDAKVPSLLGALRGANQAEFTSNPRIVLVTPETLDGLVNSFPDANARDFLSPATFALMNLTSELQKAPIYIVEPQATIDERGFSLEFDHDSETLGRPERTMKVEPGKIEASLRSKTSVFSITPKDLLSQIHLMGYLSENFRAQILNALVVAAQADPRIAGTHEARSTQLFSMLISVMGHLSVSKRLPLSLFDARPDHLGIKDMAMIRELQKRIREHPSNRYQPLIHVPSESRNQEVVSLAAFYGRDDGSTIEPGRLDLMIETSKELGLILEKSLAIALRVQSLSELRDPADWVSRMAAKDAKEEFQRNAQRILDVYARFARDLYDRDLQEMRNSSQYRPMQYYDQYRLFLLTLDAAIMRLPWAYITNFVLAGVDLAVRDLAVGQLGGLQNFLFHSQISPLTTVTHESVLLNIRGAGPLRDTKPEQIQRFHDGFSQNCGLFLRTVIGDNRP